LNDNHQHGVEASITRIWAKANSVTGQWHPLLYHLIETSAVASLLWDEILAPSTCKVIADALGLPLDEARQWSLFLVGAHDLGKASPSFQCKWAPSVLSLQQLSYRFPVNVMPIPHGRVSSIELARILKKRGVEQRTANEIARAVGGHHGVFDTASVLQQASPQAVGEGLWEESRTWIIDWLAQQHDLSALPTKRGLAGLGLLAGLTTVSDWIASSEEHFPYRPEPLGPPEDFDSLLSESKQKARIALDRLGWRTRLRLPEPLDFQKFFRISKPRPLQVESILLAAELNLPSLVIVEAPMGEGKTEAALFVAERQRQRHQLRGSFLALPTQATSNQMFSRVVKAFSQGATEGIAHILLLHGHASLSAEFTDLKRRGETGFLPSSVEPDGSTEAQVMAAEWFTYRKRGLLAPYGVGTIDQALMAALQSKHVFVRLLGLAGKVVVIDEVHAYDTYMSALLERLLAWLRAIGTSVVMLSATLPGLRRTALVKAFAPECNVSPEMPAYPCLTVVSGSQIRTIAFAAAAPGKRICLEPVPPEPAALAVWLHDRIHAGGGCAAVVCNTVGRAQEIYEACRQMMPEDAEDGAPVVDLLHSRYPFEEREAREQRTLKRFGKPGETLRPLTAVLVATQIIEQSLDIDFDLMVSELPPIDLLFQRAGRLHRHEREQRPTGETPTLGLIETPLTAEGAPAFLKGHTMVYEEHVLLRTWIALRGRSELRIPEEIRSSIEAVYADVDPGDVPQEPPLRSLWGTTSIKLQASREAHLREADLRYLPHPDSGSRLDALTAMGRDENDDWHPFFQALTRLAERAVTVACLFGRSDDLFLDRACTRPLSLNKVTMAGAAEILRRSCSISDRRVVFDLEAITVPAAWKKNALLRHCRPLVFGADDCCPVGKRRLWLCPDRGLLVVENPS
jgi:CRISPR-associated endonuclease/helicase Cas3